MKICTVKVGLRDIRYIYVVLRKLICNKYELLYYESNWLILLVTFI